VGTELELPGQAGCAQGLSLPDGWRVEVLRPRHLPPLGPEEIDERVLAGLRAAGLDEGRLSRVSSVGLLVDDTSRPTPAGLIAGPLLRHLAVLGVPESRVTVVGAVGMHRAMGRRDFDRKLGPGPAERLRLVSHHRDAPCRFLGRTSHGTPVHVNTVVAQADLCIGIGLVAPHGLAGFSGGAKIVLPGVTSMETTLHNHSRVARPQPGRRLGVGETVARLDMEEAADLAGLALSYNLVLNEDRSVAAVCGGDHRDAYRRAVAKACELGRVAQVTPADVVITGSHPKGSDLLTASRGLFAALPFCRPGGWILWHAPCEEGCGTHYLILDDPDYGRRLRQAYEDVARRYHVVLVSENLSSQAARCVLPDAIEVVPDFGPAIRAAARELPRASVNVLQAAPLLIV